MIREPYTINPGGLPEKPREPMEKPKILIVLGVVCLVVGFAFGLAAAIIADFWPHAGLQALAGASASVFGIFAAFFIIFGIADLSC